MKITDVDLVRLSRLLDEVLDLAPDGRRQWLDSLAAEHADLRPSLEAMLFRAGGIETQDFLGRMPGFDDLSDAVSVRAGEMVGPYRLIRELGSGGTASVWLGERADGTLQRQVALKLPHLGLIDRGLAARMARERDILAALEHPNIARLYDAGVDEKGRPYLAIEYVDGVSPDAYCESNALTLRQRLQLFLRIASAVAYAHARLVVHRDLKPNNILITASGDVRLLDFGIARLLMGDRQSAQQLTRVGAHALTPAYAAPEQFTGEPITVATDVYSLGVVLYELLTGRSPYSPQRSTLSALEDSVVRDEVPLASKVTPKAMARALRGDVDTILARALEKKPADRYASVESFAGDVERYLAGQPLLARAPSFWYVAGKFITRNSVPLAVSAVVAVALLTSLSVALWQWRIASRQRAVAVDRLAEAQAVTDFATAVLTQGIPQGQSVTIDEFLARGEAIAGEVGQRDLRARVAAADLVAEWYRSYGIEDKADRLLTRTIDSLPAEARNLASPLICQRSRTAAALGGNKEEIFASLSSEIARARNDPIVAARCLRDRAALANLMGDGDAALQSALGAMEQYALSGGQSLANQAELMGELGDAYSLAGHTDLAIETLEKALEMLDRAGRGNSAVMAVKRSNLGVSWLIAGHPLNARRELEAGAQIERRLSRITTGFDRASTTLAITLEMLGQYAEADRIFEHTLQTAKDYGGVFDAVYVLSGQAQSAISSGSLDRAEAILADARNYLQQQKAPPGSAPSARYKLGVARLAVARGRLEEGSAALDELISDLQAAGSYQGLQSRSLAIRSDIRLRQGNLNQAWNDASSALQVAQQLQGKLPYSCYTGIALVAQSNIRLVEHRYAEAADLLEHGARHLAETLGEKHADVLFTRDAAARARRAGK